MTTPAPDGEQHQRRSACGACSRSAEPEAVLHQLVHPERQLQRVAPSPSAIAGTTRRCPGRGPGIVASAGAPSGAHIIRPCHPCHPCRPCRRRRRPAWPAFFSGLSATSTSVVSTSAAIDAAFCECGPGDLGRVDDARLHQVLVLAGGGVEADGAGLPLDLLHHRRNPRRPALSAMSRAGASRAVHTMLAPVASSPLSACDHVGDGRTAAQQRGAATGDDAFLDGGAGRRRARPRCGASSP